MKTENISKKILILGGPTGVGKSDISFDLSLALNGEIISADSMQFYKEINIGTGKTPKWMRDKVPHHLIDFLSLREDFDVKAFVESALLCVEEILSRGKVPIIVGGSGLYIRSLLTGIFPMPEGSSERKNEIRENLASKELSELYSQLQLVDPTSASRINKNDRKRISRALEIYYLTGKTITFWHKQKSEDRLANIGVTLYFILTRSREVMYNRIERRVDEMFEEGWIKEVVRLKDEGLQGPLLYKAPIGYAEIIDYLDSKYSMEELVNLVKKKTKTYARKQLTWFRREDGIWLEIQDKRKTVEEIIKNFLALKTED